MTPQRNIGIEKLLEKIDIPDSHYDSAVKRYENIGEWLERDGSKVAKYSPHIYA